MVEKLRLDQLVFDRGLVESRELARRLIMEGHVTVNGQRVDKPGTKYNDKVLITVRALPRFVSRGGEKLQAALFAFPVEADGAICADVGASTGGFTDCLLQHGAAKVYAIDVGYGQIDMKLRNDPRVVVMERTNARFVENLPEQPSLTVIDASFISLKLLLGVIRGWMTADGAVIALIKPQFEAGRSQIGKGGVVKDPAIHRSVLLTVLQAAQSAGYAVNGLILSPLKGPAGNIEFLAHLGLAPGDSIDLAAAIDAALPTDPLSLPNAAPDSNANAAPDSDADPE